MKTWEQFDRFVIPVLALMFGIGAALALAALLGESPIKVLQILLRGAFGSETQVGYSLYYATPLIFTGLSVAWAFRAGLFNIGAEGQMAMGSLALVAFALKFPNLPWFLGLPLAFLCAFIAGGLWSAIAGWIKVKRGCHEVLITIMLNFIAAGVSSFFILKVFKNPESQVPETAAVSEFYRLQPLAFGGTSPVNTSLFFALVIVAIFGFVFLKTKFGFYQKMTGAAPEVGRRAGVNIDRQIILAMFISGGLAGLAGISQILGYATKMREGFTAGAGFIGVAVALLGRNAAIGIVLAALLFGVLSKGALDLDLDTEKMTRDLAMVIQAFIVLAVASHRGLADLSSYLQERFKRRV